MIKNDYVSLWLGNFKNETDFRSFIEVKYTDDGDLIPSKFQSIFNTGNYDMDTSEVDWISTIHEDISDILNGFSYGSSIISEFKEMLKAYDIKKYNCVILLYNYTYNDNNTYSKNGNYMEYIGSIRYNK